MTIFLGCGFAAKYLAGGGNFSVPLQWMLGLRRLKRDAVWLEVLPSSGNPDEDRVKIDNFRRRLREHGLGRSYCLLLQKPCGDEHDLDAMNCVGMSKRELLARLARPSTLLNLSYSIHPPLLLEFERRVFCDLDPSEIFYWMTKMELGQSTHHEFWTIGLNVHGRDCELPRAAVAAPFSRGDLVHVGNSRRPVRQAQGRLRAVATTQKIKWRTFYPLVDTKLIRKLARPLAAKFTTIGQWYWSGAVEVGGEFPDLSKKFAFEKYLDLPKLVPDAKFELAMNINADDPERRRLEQRGWILAYPHRVARTPRKYRRYIAGSLGEFTAIKGVDVAWRTGWLSDRAATFLASGRPVITEDTGAEKYLPPESGFRFVIDQEQAVAAIREVLNDWPRFSRAARECAVEVFDSAKNVRRILG